LYFTVSSEKLCQRGETGHIVGLIGKQKGTLSVPF
jgi:hypothetical protein